MPIHHLAQFDLRLALLIGCCLPWQVAHAQGLPPSLPSQSQTPPGVEIDRQTKDAQIDFTIGGVAAVPQGAEAIQITIGDIVLDGGFDPVASDAVALLPRPGNTVSLADIYAAAAAVQQAYLAAGFPLVRVFVPMQDLDRANAIIRLQVVSGFVGEVRTDALDPKIRDVVARYLTPLIGRQRLSAAVLERAVLLAGDVSGVELASALSPGDQTGETILIVSGRYRPVQAVLSADNRLSSELGREQITLSSAFNSLLGMGERIGVTFATTFDDPSFSRSALRRYAGIYADLPIGSDGLVIGGDASVSTARPKGAAAFLALSSRFEHFGGRVSYPLVRSRTGRLIASGSFDYNSETQDSLLLGFPVPLSRDTTRVGRLALNASLQSTASLFASAEIEYSRGLDIFDARRAGNASIFEPLSRIGADAVFDKLSTSLTVEARLPRYPVTGRITMRAQTGFGDPLLRSEQLSIAAPDLVSGPPSGSLVGDSAFAARYQIEAVAYSVDIRLVPYAFAAAARATLERPTFFERPRTDTHAYGVGLNAQIPIGSFTFTTQIEYSHTRSDDPLARGNWVTFQASLRF